MDGLDGLQDLLPEPQRGAHGEGPSGLTPPQVGKVTALQRHGDGRLATTPRETTVKVNKHCKKHLKQRVNNDNNYNSHESLS